MVNIRKATTKDLPELVTLFTKLLEYLESKGNQLYTDDPNQFMGGIMEFLVVKMEAPGNTVLVQVDEKDQPIAFIVGWIISYPQFFKYHTLGEIQFMYPLAFATKPLLQAFDAWAKAEGAAARSSYATPGHETSWRMMMRDGMGLGLYHFYKPYEDVA